MLPTVIDRIATFITRWISHLRVSKGPAPSRRVASLSISAPRQPGSYAQRARDCEQAIEPIFLRETVNSTSPYVDLDRVLVALSADAIRAGWSEAELTDAIIRLAARHRLRRRG